MEMDYYCMYQRVGFKNIIFGIGLTEDEARADAKQYAEDMDSLIMGRCTEQVADNVRKHGGDNGYEVY